MKANTLKAGLLAIVASSALLTTSVYAEQQSRCQDSSYHMKGDRMSHHGGMKSSMKKMFRGLDLTDEQRTEIKTLMKAQKESMQDSRPTSDERLAHKAEMLSLITAGSFDETQAKELMLQKQAKRQQKALSMLKVQNEIYKLLTPEQQIKFKENFEKGHSRHERKGGR
ncbi:Spy/CpxP family protein refolding chaperone [uncultured Shewanella sp.]|uniref:Spy/CpxP family protein refolding chaperone n=1 Tax=Shewanella atlantica TaxID=271099 RepID=UPI00262C661E|nr:Spy/CpxP family protein refolding chaperone [uncultured Shewanella sp.]